MPGSAFPNTIFTFILVGASTRDGCRGACQANSNAGVAVRAYALILDVRQEDRNAPIQTNVDVERLVL